MCKFEENDVKELACSLAHRVDVCAKILNDLEELKNASWTDPVEFNLQPYFLEFVINGLVNISADLTSFCDLCPTSEEGD